MYTIDEILEKYNLTQAELMTTLRSCGYITPYADLSDIQKKVLTSYLDKTREVKIAKKHIPTITVKEIAEMNGLTVNTIKTYITLSKIISDNYQTVTLENYRKWQAEYEFSKGKQTCVGCGKEFNGSKIHFETKLCPKCVEKTYKGGYVKPDVFNVNTPSVKKKQAKLTQVIPNTEIPKELDTHIKEIDKVNESIDYSTAQEEYQDVPDIQESFGYTQEEIEYLMCGDEEDTIDLDTFELPADVKKLRDEKGFDGLLNVRQDNPDNFLDQETTDHMLDTKGMTGNRGPLCGDVGVNLDKVKIAGSTSWAGLPGEPGIPKGYDGKVSDLKGSYSSAREDIVHCTLGMDKKIYTEAQLQELAGGAGSSGKAYETDKLVAIHDGVGINPKENLVHKSVDNDKLKQDPLHVEGEYLVRFLDSKNGYIHVVEHGTPESICEIYKNVVADKTVTEFKLYKLQAEVTPKITVSVHIKMV